MKTNWQKTVDEINRSRYVVPDGWDTRDQVAESLQCAPERVSDLLKPGIQNGDIERQEFSVWDDKRRMAVRVMCYRVASTQDKPSSAKPGDLTAEDRILRSLATDPDRDDRLISKNLHVPITLVRKVRNSLKQ